MVENVIVIAIVGLALFYAVRNRSEKEHSMSKET